MDTSNMGVTAAARRSFKETEKRNKINLKIAELQQTLGENFQRKMSTEEVLRVAYQLVKHLKSVALLSPKTKGFYDGLYEMKDRTVSFIKSLQLNKGSSELFIQNMTECFAGYQVAPSSSPDAMSSITPSTSGTSSVTSSELPSRESSPPVDGLEMDPEEPRKQLRKNREKNRRNRQTNAFDELGKLVHISNFASKINKLQILEVIIDFINTSRGQTLTSQNQLKYNEGLTMGKLIGKGVAENYFKNDHHLAAQYGPLRVYLEPAIEFPIAPTIRSVTKLGTVFLPQLNRILFPIIDPILPLPSTTLLTPPSSSPDSSSSSPRLSSGESSSFTPVPENNEKKLRVIFRPWE